MAFDYEGAKAEGWSDTEIAEHLSKKHKFNISGARGEGYAESEIVKHLIGKEESFYQRNIPESIKNAIGGVESVGRMLWNVPAGMVAKGIGTLTGKVLGEDLGMALERGDEAAHRVSIDPFTKQGGLADQAMSEAYEKLYRETAGNIGAEDVKYDPNAPAGSVRADPRNEAKARSFYEFGADVLAAGGLLRGAARQMPQRGGDYNTITSIKEIPPKPVPESVPRGQGELPLTDRFARQEEIMAQRRAQAREELRTTDEQSMFLEQELTGQRPLIEPFGRQPSATMREDFQRGSYEAAQAAIDQQVPRSPYERQITPPQLEKLNRSMEREPPHIDSITGKRLPSAQWESPDPNRPFYGDPRVGITRELPETRYDLSRTPVNEQPITPAERQPIVGRRTDLNEQLMREHPQETPSRWFNETTQQWMGDLPQRPYTPIRETPRFMEAVDRDPVLRGMNTKINKAENLVRNLREQASEPMRLLGEASQKFQQKGEHIFGDQWYPRALQDKLKYQREVTAFEKAIKAQEKEVAKLRKQAENRLAKIESQVKTPKAEHTFTPPRKQRGAVDARILSAIASLGMSEFARAGFTAIKKLKNGYELRASVERMSDDFMDVKDGGLKVKLLSPDGRELGEANFVVDKGRQNLYSRWTEVGYDYNQRKELGGKFMSGEIYKFASELGNTIEPDVMQTHGGKAMWEKFQKQGIAVESGEGFPIIPAAWPDLFAGPGKRQRGALMSPDDWGKTLSGLISPLIKKGDSTPSPKAPERSTILQAAEGEVRPWGEFKNDHGPFEELPQGIFNKTLQYLSNPQMVFNDTKNGVVKYIADFAANAKAESVLAHELLTKGVSLGKGLWQKKVISPDSPFSQFHDLSRKDQQIATNVINKYNGTEYPTTDAMRALGANEKVIQSLKKLQQPLHDAWVRVNEAREAVKLKPLPFRPFYFMKAAGFGNWAVRVRIGEETLAFHRMPFKWQADSLASKLENQLRKDHPDLTTHVDPVNRESRGNKYNVNTSLLEEIISALETNDPRRVAIQSAIQDIKSHGGHAVHGVHRKGVQGMDLTPKNFWETYDSYIKDSETYIANLKIKKLQDDVRLSMDIPPNLKRYALDHLELSRGGKDPKFNLDRLEDGLDAIVNWGTRGQTGSGATRAATKVLNKAFLTQALLFYKPAFIIGQALQSTGFAPMALAHWKYNLGYNKASSTEAFLKAGVNLATNPSKYKEVMDFLGYRGKIDPNLVSELSFLKGGKWQQIVNDWVFGAAPARFTESMGRIHSAAIGYEFLSAQGLKGKELHMAVERFSDDLMGNYSMTERPGLISRTGIAGEMMKPLSTFSNWFHGMNAVLMKETINGIKTGNMKKAIPFMNFWLSTMIMGGLTGSIGWTTIDAIFNKLKGSYGEHWFKPLWKAAFNEQLSENSPSLTERIMTSGLPDWVTLGAITDASKAIDDRGIYLSGSMTAPDLQPSVAAHGWGGLVPGLTYGVDALSSVGALMFDQLDFSAMTAADRKQAYKNIAPSILDSILENIDTDYQSPLKDLFKKGLGMEGDKPIPGGPRGQGTVRRDEFETMASIIGGGTIPEYKERVARRDIKNTEQATQEKYTKLVDLGVDDLIHNEGQNISKYAQQAVDLGFPDYVKSVLTQMKNRQTTETERESMNVDSLRELRRLQYLQQQRREARQRVLQGQQPD